MKLLVLACAVFPDESTARQKLWIFLKSCEKYGAQPAMYGIGDRFPGYRAMCLDMQLAHLKTVTGYSHVLFTDSWDAFFCAPLTEIISKYERLGSPPILTSAYTGFADNSAPAGFDDSIRLRYPHRGGYIAEIPAIIDAFERMLQLPNQTGDDSFNWRDSWLEGWFRPMLDSNCEIFQVTDENCVTGLKRFGDGVHDLALRLFNSSTHSAPCILHLSGGYTSPETGKDDRMIPWAKRLGVIE